MIIYYGVQVIMITLVDHKVIDSRYIAGQGNQIAHTIHHP